MHDEAGSVTLSEERPVPLLSGDTGAGHHPLLGAHSDDGGSSASGGDPLSVQSGVPAALDAAQPRHHGPTGWPPAAFYILAVELCERLAYYGASIVFFTYMRSMLEFSQGTANALYNCFSFWAYGSCLIGGYAADAHLGRVSAIQRFSLVYLAGLTALVLSALPFAWSDYPHSPSSGAAIPAFGVAVFLIGLGTGGIKANVSPLLADQMTSLDPHVYASVFRWFYWSINVGAFAGILVTPLLYSNIGEPKALPSSTEAAADTPAAADTAGTGYWAAFLLPLILFACGLALYVVGWWRGLYVAPPPQGSVLAGCFRAARFALRHRSAAAAQGGDHQADAGSSGTADAADTPGAADTAPPQHWLSPAVASPEHAGCARDLKVTLRACSVFLWYPVYWLCYNQMFSNMVAQAELLERPAWLASEALNVVDAGTLILLLPLFDRVVFPALRRAGWDPGAITRISVGFLLAACSILYCAGVEFFIRQRGTFDDGRYILNEGASRLSVWWQLPPYVIFALSELFASVGGIEFAYTEAPASMKSVVMSLYLFTTAAGSLLGIAVSPAIRPENMFVVFMIFGIAMLLTAAAFSTLFRSRVPASSTA